MKEKTIYALGFFDGVHLAHQALLRACRELANNLGVQAGVVTFTSHPDTLVSGIAPKLINTPEDRKRLLLRYGMDTVIELPFDKQLMNMPWQDFFKKLLQDFGAAGVVCGDDFRFGHRGEGNAERLQQACHARSIPCIVVPQQKIEGTIISSTHIRRLLQTGEMEQAVHFLGHPHILTGSVVSGRQLGRKMGIPTANLLLTEELVQPRFGVYACKARLGEKSYLAVTNIGTRPTVGGHRVTVEPWLLDFQGDLYGRELTLEFHAFLRPEQKFENLEALQEEIRKNAGQTRKILGNS